MLYPKSIFRIVFVKFILNCLVAEFQSLNKGNKGDATL
jgi:hypothetical protein